MSFHILLVEDEPNTAQMVRYYLAQEGWQVIWAGSGPAGYNQFQQHPPHLIILDLMLPGYDGFELCRRLRQQATLPILMLTARTTDTDKAIGLGIGADDYLTKPFSPIELIARVKALLRRSYEYNEPAKPPRPLGGPRLQCDPLRRLVTLDGQAVELTVKEFELLLVLLTNPGWVFTRAHLLEKVWGFQDEAGEDTVTVHLNNLRNKLGPDGASLIRTIRGVGYAYQE